MQLSDVNTTDIRGAVTLGCRTMSHIFNRDDNDIPFFGSSVYPSAGFGFHPFHSESHIPGRHLNALLSAEDVLGIRAEKTVVDKHAKAAYFSYSGSVALPLNRDRIGGSLVNFSPHNIREGFHALYALTRFRKSERAHALAEKSIATINALWSPTTGWNRARLEKEKGLHIIEFDSPFIGGIARAIGPLVKYYQATGSPAALRLATVIKDKALAEYFPASGAFDMQKLGTHTHSITCTLSSLAQMATATKDAALMDRVKAFYDNGLNSIRNEIGWSPENARPEANQDRGEGNNTGDILETALLLAQWGHTDYYNDAERILRCHLLPSQLRDTSFIREPANPEDRDDKRDVALRHRGAWGFPAPYGHLPLGMGNISFNLDIVGGVVGSLCEAYRASYHINGDTCYVNMTFDCDTKDVFIRSPYAPSPHRSFEVRLKRRLKLAVRPPSWVTLQEGQRLEGAGHVEKGYIHVTSSPGTLWHMELEFPKKEVVLRYRNRQIRATLQGDRIATMENFGTDFTFFPS